MKTRIAFWFLFFVAIFCIAYTATDLLVKNVMASYVPPTEKGYTALEVTEPKYTQRLHHRENTGTQTDNHYKVQHTLNPNDVVVQEVLPTSLQIDGLTKIYE